VTVGEYDLAAGLGWLRFLIATTESFLNRFAE
jgi:hypothetical protein